MTTTIERKLSKKEIEKQEIDKYKTMLLELIKPGETIYTGLDHVSKSGMMRHVSVYVVNAEKEIQRINFWVSKVAGYSRTDNQSLKVQGCGMDVGFEVIYNLGRALFPDGVTCIGDKCQSNDHSNGDRDYTPHKHSDGGYTFRHQWL